MFSTRGLFQSLPCPRKPNCTHCPFSHAAQDPPVTPLIATPTPTPTPASAKRPFELTDAASSSEPPPQRIRTASAPKPVARPAHQSSVRPLPFPPFRPFIPSTHRPARLSSESMPHSHKSPSLSARFASPPCPDPSLIVPTGHAQESL